MNSPAHENPADAPQNSHLDTLYAKVVEASASFSKFGIDRRVFEYDRDCVVHNIHNGLVEEPRSEDEWVAAIICEHLEFSDLIGPNGLNLISHWE